jgi:hypothetical protein
MRSKAAASTGRIAERVSFFTSLFYMDVEIYHEVPYPRCLSKENENAPKVIETFRALCLP